MPLLSPAQIRGWVGSDLQWPSPDSPFYNIENQHGGLASNNYYAQNGAEAIIAAKDETNKVLKERL